MNTGSPYHEEIMHVTRKGQVTVPVAIRKALGLREGDKVAFVLTDREKLQATLRPVPSVATKTFGTLASSVPMLSVRDERLAFQEGMADEEEAENRG